MERFKIRLLGISLFILLTAVTLQFCSPQIQAKINNKTVRLLEENNLHWAKTSVDGRHVSLNGVAPTEAQRRKAVTLTRSLWGSVDVIDNITVAEPVSPFSFEAEFDGKRLSLSGYINGEEDQQRLQQQSQQLYGADNIVAALTIAGGQPPHWVSVISNVLEQTPQLQSGKIHIQDQSISIHGKAESIEIREQFSSQLSTLRDRGYDLLLDIEAPPPEPSCQEKFTRILSNEQIQFSNNAASVRDESSPLLDKLAEVATSCSEAQITIAGHTDSVGSDTANKVLSTERAQAVAQHLVDRGIETARLNAVGFGESRPIASNDTAAGKSRNRRIEFTITTNE